MSEYLKRAGKRDVSEVFDIAKGVRQRMGFEGNAFTKNKTSRLRALIPKWVLFDAEHKKYFDSQADTHDFNKNIELFLKKHPEFAI